MRIKQIKFIGVALILAGLFILSCDNTTEPEESPFVGTWELSNLNQHTILKTNQEYPEYELPEGYTLADTTLTWQDFQAMGVEGQITLEEDGDFTLTGSLPLPPSPNDTLGTPLDVIQMQDAGTWSVDANLDTFTLNGAVFNRSGELNMDDQENPTTISLDYTLVTVRDVYMMIGQNTYAQIAVYDSSVSTIGFTNQ